MRKFLLLLLLAVGLCSQYVLAQTSPTVRVNSIAELVAVKIPTITSQFSAIVAGYYNSTNSGPTRTFIYNAQSTLATNRCRVFKPLVGSGRWIDTDTGPINVMCCGAKGNGTFDDTPAITNAVYVASLTPTNTVFLSPGNFVTGTISFLAGACVNFEGSGIGETFLTPLASNQVLINRDNIMDNVSIGGFTVTAHASGSTGEAINLMGFRHSKFHDIEFKSNGSGNYKKGFVLDASARVCYNNTITGVSVLAQSGPDILVECNNSGSGASSNPNVNYFSNFHVINNTGMTNVFDLRRSALSVLEKSLIEGNSSAVGVIPGTMTTIRENWFELNSAAIAPLSGADGASNSVLVEGNYFSGVQSVTLPNTVQAWCFFNNAGGLTITDNSVNSIIFNGQSANIFKVTDTKTGAVTLAVENLNTVGSDIAQITVSSANGLSVLNISTDGNGTTYGPGAKITTSTSNQLILGANSANDFLITSTHTVYVTNKFGVGIDPQYDIHLSKSLNPTVVERIENLNTTGNSLAELALRAGNGAVGANLSVDGLGSVFGTAARLSTVTSSAMILGSNNSSDWQIDTSHNASALLGDIIVSTAGKGFKLKEGSNARMGTATLVGGESTVANTSVTANTRIFLTSQVDGGTPGWLRVDTRTASTSFHIQSSSVLDTSTVAWILFEPSP